MRRFPKFKLSLALCVILAAIALITANFFAVTGAVLALTAAVWFSFTERDNRLINPAFLTEQPDDPDGK